MQPLSVMAAATVAPAAMTNKVHNDQNPTPPSLMYGSYSDSD
jgi:hypothetical protein